MTSRQRVARLGAALVLATVFVSTAYAAGAWWQHRRGYAARRLLEQHDYRPAAHQLLRMLVARPDDPVAHYDLGRAYTGLGLTAAARRQFADAVRLSPDNATFHAALARAYRADGDEARAIVEFDKAIRRDPTTSDCTAEDADAAR